MKTDAAVIILINTEIILETEIKIKCFCYLTNHHSASNYMHFSTVIVHNSCTYGAIYFWKYTLFFFN